MKRNTVFYPIALILALSQAAAFAASPWLDTSRPCRVAIHIAASGFPRSERPIDVPLNFNSIVASLSLPGSIKMESLRLMEVGANGAAIHTDVPYQFDRAKGQEAAANPNGTLIFLLSGATLSNATRHYQLYFAVGTGTFTAPTFTPLVSVQDNVMDEGQSSFKITTRKGDWYYHKEGAGFSSLVDRDGGDWISYSTATGSAGEFRGIPNTGHKEGYMHPGKTMSNSTLFRQGPLKITFESLSKDGLWGGYWEMYPDYSVMTITKVSHDYWFLYEGTPGGTLSPASDYWVRADGSQGMLNTTFAGNAAMTEDWVYFADSSKNRSLFLVQPQDFSEKTTYYLMNNEMTVFGFGREGAKMLIPASAVPRKFAVGLFDNRTYSVVKEGIQSAYKNLVISTDTAEVQDASVSVDWF